MIFLKSICFLKKESVYSEEKAYICIVNEIQTWTKQYSLFFLLARYLDNSRFQQTSSRVYL